jgi:hypothetical protein
MREDRNVLDLLRADYTFLNERLARHYGISGIYGSHFRRVRLNDERRFGLLGKGSVLAVTSYPNRTAPTIRGKWLLENVLGTPPGAPPPNVPALEENVAGKGPRSVRERLEEHRRNPVCANCHRVMDPLGFALENFDAVGAWRTTDAGSKVDSSGLLADGTQVSGPVELREALLGRPEVFVGTMSEKLLTYALGRGVEFGDMPFLRQIVRQSRSDDYRFSSLVLNIVKSVPFQMRRASASAATEGATAQVK